MAGLNQDELADLVTRYLDREGVDSEPLQLDLDRLFDDNKVRRRIGEVITAAVLGRPARKF